MERNTIGILMLLGIFLFLLFMKMEIMFAILTASVCTMLYLELPLTLVVTRGLTILRSYGMLAIPLFIIAGEVLSDGSLSDKIIEFVESLVGWIRGGMALVNVAASTFFGGISGSPLADISSLGTVLIPMMKKQGYDEEFATNITITSAQQGLLIPPSHNMIIYAMAAGGVASVSKLFLAGIVPGLLLALVLMIYSFYQAVKKGYPKGEPFNFVRLIKTFFTSFWGLMTLVIIIVGSTTGVFTATESAAIAILWALFVTTFIYRDMTPKRLWDLLGRCIVTVSRILIVMSISASFGFVIAYLRVPETLSNMIYGVTDNPIVIMLIINLILILLGMIMDMGSILIISTPIFLPIAMGIGVDPVHFGIIMIFNLALGMMTPPVGGALMMGHLISGVKMERLYVTLIPFFIIMGITLLIITFVPSITMTLPNLLSQ
ncbi:TRAP transporter large permease [Proteiniclasticum sp. SCR006]|uniref:TRAP transporter large permease n=1 Tax=Proteiniclasticum aestuarii TaxID=2817862 RepID=A0A939KF44_9CLOT|nr:TRAP transporter large permease [Proteiniclasticum aestuarii]MBO1264072.1 TRAP transporter large permease [Proteiniclasticum aestuarii]